MRCSEGFTSGRIDVTDIQSDAVCDDVTRLTARLGRRGWEQGAQEARVLGREAWSEATLLEQVWKKYSGNE